MDLNSVESGIDLWGDRSLSSIYRISKNDFSINAKKMKLNDRYCQLKYIIIILYTQQYVLL